jgi:hypothetical protein
MEDIGLMDERRQCTAKSKQSQQRCKRAPVPGLNVCKIHGGGTQAAQSTAKVRLAALVDPAIRTLVYAMSKREKQLQQALQAANSVLDRTGHGTKSTLEVVDPQARIAALNAGRERARMSKDAATTKLD